LGVFAATAVLLFLSSAAPSIFAQAGRIVRAKDFKHAEFYEKTGADRGQTNQLRGLILGVEADFLSSDLVAFKQMRLESYDPQGRTNLVAQAPHCWFDQRKRIASSPGRLEVRGAEDRLFIEGNEGFLFRMTNSSLVLSNRVRTVIRQDLVRSATP
jgi:hypothetical protein